MFIDTNVLLQCKPIHEIKWNELGVWSDFNIIITRPVQAEIDSLKGKGSGRISSRARSASALIRKLLDADNETIKLKDNPLVMISLRHDLKRDESVSKILDYSERDDQLVGTALQFKKDNSDLDVLLLTNDTGPMASAKTLGLLFLDIPTSWMLEPESDEADKKEKLLKDELDKYKKLEPKFNILVDEELELKKQPVYLQLSFDEIEDLIKKLKYKHPPCTDFGSKNVAERESSGIQSKLGFSIFLHGGKEVFTPATIEEIDSYNSAYDDWITECRNTFHQLHNKLQAQHLKNEILLSIENSGTRPSKDTLIIFRVDGNMLLEAPKKKTDEIHDDHAAEDNGEIRLNPPPSPPKGVWNKVSNTPLTSLERLAGVLDAINLYPNRTLLQPPMIRDFSLPTRDPNAIYFKKGQRGVPSHLFEYECEQWRHAQSPQEFQFNIWVPLKAGEYKAMLNIEVHADNLTEPSCFKRLIKITAEENSCFLIGESMIDTI